MTKIDVVVTWVDGTDPVWLEEKRKYIPDGTFHGSDKDLRYRPSELFRYWFRGIEKFAPWVNKVFFVTYGHVPSWLNVNHPKLKIIKHTDYIPKQYLPTYNSNVIELNLHRIEELSEQFILFNDDMFTIKPVNETDFFKNGKARDVVLYRSILPDEDFSSIEFNNVKVINKYFSKSILKRKFFENFKFSNGKDNIHNLISLLYSKIPGYRNSHLPKAHFKSTFSKLWELENERLTKVCLNRFRQENDVNHFLMAHWNIESDRVITQSKHFGCLMNISLTEDVKNSIEKNKYHLICINDDLDQDDGKAFEILDPVFKKILRVKSSFEV